MESTKAQGFFNFVPLCLFTLKNVHLITVNRCKFLLQFLKNLIEYFFSEIFP